MYSTSLILTTLRRSMTHSDILLETWWYRILQHWYANSLRMKRLSDVSVGMNLWSLWRTLLCKRRRRKRNSCVQTCRKRFPGMEQSLLWHWVSVWLWQEKTGMIIVRCLNGQIMPCITLRKMGKIIMALQERPRKVTVKESTARKKRKTVEIWWRTKNF